ncbi:MAG: hypothetical protein IKC49_02115 [Clostridia bacterium]|nr:hypothetical protein [Clostridia bacterium]
MNPADEMWLSQCASQVSKINDSTRSLRSINFDQKDPKFIKNVKSKYIANLKAISDKKKFFIFFLKKYIEEHNLFNICTIIDEKVYFPLLDMLYQLYDSSNNILLYPHLFVQNPENFSISEDYYDLIAWYKAYLKDPDETIDDLASQLFEEHITRFEEDISKEKEKLRTLQKELAPYDEQLKDKKPIKDNWFNFQFRPRRLELQAKRQKILDEIEYVLDSIQRKQETIDQPKNTRDHYDLVVRFNFEKRFKDIKLIIPFLDILKEVQYRLTDDNMYNPNRNRLSNDFYYYFEYYRLQYNLNCAKQNLYELYAKAFMPQNIFDEYEALDKKDRNLLIDESFEEIKEMYESFLIYGFDREFNLD